MTDAIKNARIAPFTGRISYKADSELSQQSAALSPTYDASQLVNLTASGGSFLDNLVGTITQYLPLTGGTLSGPLILHNNPTTPFGAATKQYVDTNIAAQAVDFLTPEMFGAVGDGITDDSVAFATLFTQAQAEKKTIRLSSKRYFLNSTTMPKITWPISIYGDGPAATTIVIGSNYRGAFILADELIGLNSEAHDKGGVIWRGFTVIGSRTDENGALIPLGTQHGIVLMGRCDRISVQDVVIERLRGWGIAIGTPGTIGIGYLRESVWYDVRVRECGAGMAYANFDILMHNSSSDQSNNVWFHGILTTASYGSLLRFQSNDNRKRGGHLHFIGIMIHGANDTNPVEADVNWNDFPLVDIDGEVNNISLLKAAANAAKNWTGRIRNSFRKTIMVSPDAVSTTIGSNRVTVQLPVLPERLMTQGDASTVRGSPLIYFYWPGHTMQRYDFVTFDRIVNGTRTNFQYGNSGQFNGLFPRGDMIVQMVDDNGIWVMARGGLATSSGTCNLAAYVDSQRTLRQSYGFTPGTDSISFDTWAGEQRINTTLTVGDILLNGARTVQAMPSLYSVQIDFLNAASSTTTSSFGAEQPLILGANMIGPGTIRIEGSATSGKNGWWVEAGNEININMPIPAVDVDFKVGPGIRRGVQYSAEGREGGYVLDIDPSIAHLVGGGGYAAAPSLPMRTAVHSVGIYKQAQSYQTVLWAFSAGTSTRRLTTDSSQFFNKANTWSLPRAGTYLFRGLVVARQRGGTSGTIGDSARWSIEALVTWDGTSGNVIVEEVNGSSGNVGIELSPAGSRGAGSAWRLTISADSAWDALAWTVKGAASKTIYYTAHINRVDTYQE